MARRRGNHEGSLYFHKPSRKWSAQVSLDGRRLTKYFETQKEGREWIREVNSQIDNGLTYKAAKLRVDKYLKEWLKNIEPTLKPKTWNQYKQIVNQEDTEILLLKSQQEWLIKIKRKYSGETYAKHLNSWTTSQGKLFGTKMIYTMN